MELWIENIYAKPHYAIFKDPAILVWNQFTTHKTEFAKMVLKRIMQTLK